MNSALPALLIAGLVVSSASAALAAPDPAIGEWLTQDGMARVAIAPCSSDPARACGAITWLKDPVGHPTRDVHNPDRALRGRPLVGMLIVREMRPEGPGRWSGGALYDPETGRSGEGTLKALSRNRLEVAGCKLFICEREVWTRADETRPD